MRDPQPHATAVPSRPHRKWRWSHGAIPIGRTADGADVLIDARTLTTHMHVIGASGFGKSKLLETFARIVVLALDGSRRSLIVLDPHGTLVKALLCWIATYRLDKYRRIHVVDPSGSAVAGINPLRLRPGIDPAFIAQTLKNAIMSAWGDAEAMPQLQESLLAILYTLCALGWTLLEAELLCDITDRLGVRQFIIDHVSEPQIRRIWTTLDALPAAKIEEKLGAAVRRLLSFLLPQAVRRMLSQQENVIDFRAAMDQGDIVLIDLSYGNGRISADESSLLGKLMLADVYLSALGRPAGATQTLLIIIDECQKFLIDVVADTLDQARKFGLSLVLAHQHLGHLREAGEHLFRSVMTNARTKVVFGGLDDDDATLLARNLFRGVLDLELPKHGFDRPTVVGQEYDWLASEGSSRGSARATGSTWSESASHAASHGTTTSQSRTASTTHATTRSTTRSRARAQSHTETDQRSHSDSRSSATSVSDTRSSSYAQSVGLSQNFPGWLRSRTSRVSWPEAGAMINDTDTETRGSAATTGSSSAASVADTYGTSRSVGLATSAGQADSRGVSESHAVADTTGTAISDSATVTTSRAIGGSASDTTSRSETTGRAQTLRAVFQTLPTQAYSLQELHYFGSTLLGNELAIGEAIAKIGNNPPVRLKTLRVKPGWASDTQVERLKERLAAESPFVTSLPEARERYQAHRKRVMGQICGAAAPPQLPPAAVPNEEPDATTAPSPPLKDEGWS